MHYVFLVQLLQPQEYLLDDTLQVGRFDRDIFQFALVHHPAQVKPALFKHKEEIRLVFVVLFRF